jgi:hypothetical protein
MSRLGMVYFNPSTLPADSRRIASFNRLRLVSSRLADSIQAKYRRPAAPRVVRLHEQRLHANS